MSGVIEGWGSGSGWGSGAGAGSGSGAGAGEFWGAGECSGDGWFMIFVSAWTPGYGWEEVLG